MLLAVAALNIVVMGNIPMVGYLTDFDKYDNYMFGTLVGCCAAHQVVVRLSSKEERLHTYPLRMFYIRLLETIARVMVIPLVLLAFSKYFETVINSLVRSICVAGVVIFISFALVRELPPTYKTFNNSCIKLRLKLQQGVPLSWVEILVFNMYYHHKLSWIINIEKEIHLDDNISASLEMNSMDHHHQDDTNGIINNPINSLNISNGIETDKI